MTPQMPLPHHPPARRLLRATTILFAVALLHLLAGIWSARQTGRAADPSASEAITVSLEPAPPPSPKPVPKASPKPPPKPHPKPPAPRPPPAPPAAPAAPAAEAPPLITGGQGNWQTAAGNGDEGGNAPADVVAPPMPASEPAPAPHPPAHAADAPPSVTLKYNVQGLRDGQKVYGSSKIAWRNQDGRYRIDGNASVLFFTLLQFSSDGVLDDSGVSPTLYSEKRFRKTATDTRFEHERNTITFSASDNRYPRPGDAQDRASFIWQLATIGRGNPAAFFTGADFTMLVAGVRDAEPWRIIVSGEDEIDADGGAISAWHLVRMPQPGSYDQKIDIWLAPGRQWYPLKIRYTEDNGDYLEMSISSLTPA
ncbi:DUF3108 domain-containing protein [Oxalobacteraceae bacterium CAVE-383]|nr:DUF3108 domain-containing protein [Oxalobacteraceae bacterium CAVE-383]